MKQDNRKSRRDCYRRSLDGFPFIANPRCDDASNGSANETKYESLPELTHGFFLRGAIKTASAQKTVTIALAEKMIAGSANQLW